ncbi:hypothetical protein FNH13_18870 [Ornithinimicrobium ciconiae]|uniref:Lipoprotein with Yx(FWY)xxD motif n=1 Tax=Ornithinimicrobium ciconiae TaxID=2594265 RepID=A0A516GF32_9MICO|nr:hypothetical protein [Ornithinimicrobium ciconiae]QDO90133.1 hypothetical protein FNH13_18870 [Ornithinimicrobium ciconiae]
MHRSLMLWPACLLAATVLTACGSDDPDQSDTPTPREGSSQESTGGDETSEDTAASDDTADDSQDTAMGPGPVVTTADTDLGTILVDGDGMTLYLFTQDSPNSSVCLDDCLVAWPILEGEPSAGGDADDSKLGSLERADGTVQATYNDWPLYYFAQDQAPGDVTGQGVNDVWWVLDTDGEAITGATGDDASNGYDY